MSQLLRFFLFYRQLAWGPTFTLWLALLLAGPAAWAQPTVTGFLPASGPSGSSVTVTGTGFTNVTSVRFGELSATFVVNNTGQLTAVVPRAASTQVINVTTTAGSEISPTAFATTRNGSLTYTLKVNNFSNVSVGSNAAPAVGDLDRDGLLDLLVGRADGTISRYEQTGANSTTFAPVGLLATSGGTIDRGAEATVAIVDTDSNGKFNVLVGGADGYVYDYEQTAAGSATFVLVNDFVGQISTTTNSAPSVTNLDGDGRLELVTGKGDGIVSFAEQNLRNSEDFTIYDTNYQTLTNNTAPFCVDLDGNGLVDVLIGVGGGTIYHFEQSAANNRVLTQKSSSFNNINVGSNAKPCVTDLDGNGLLDLLIGRANGTIDRYEQTPPTNVAPTDISLSNTSVAENQPVNTAVGTFGTTDANVGNTFTYTFSSGGADNGSFNILNNSTLATNGVFNFENNSSYSVKIRTTDQGGLFFEKTFTITVTDVNETPTITNFTPTSGVVGTANVVITGTNFTSAGPVTVRFNGTTATTATVNSNTQLTATVPAGATTGRITVQNADGTGTSGTDFTVLGNPNTTIVSGPPTLGNSRTVSFVFSSDQSPVDYTTTGDPSFAYTGNGPSSSFGPVPNGTYTLSVAARNTTTGLTDPSPATYTFTVDATAPTVVVTSSAGSSGGSTGTAPIPFTITFSENVSGFDTPDVTVTGGTFTASAVSDSMYNVLVTPTAPGSVVTVRVAAGGATDAAGNGNAASNTYSLTYAPAPVITSLSPSSGPVGTSVTIMGTGLAGVPNNVRFNGTAVQGLTGNGAGTLLTTTVPAGATTGPVTVTTPNGTSNTNAIFTVTAASTSTTLTSSANPSVYRQSVLYTATVRNTNGTSPPTGTVTFKEGSTTLGSGTLDASGVATYSNSLLSVGSHALTAVYEGTTAFSTSTSAGLTQVVNAATTSTALSSNLNPAVFGQSVTFRAVVTTQGASAGQAAGTVTFHEGSTVLGTGTLAYNDLLSSAATLATSTLAVGSHPITATYGTDGSYAASTSAALTQVVNAPTPVNQAPVVTAPATQNVPFNTNLTFSAANGNALSVADADAASGQLSVYISVGFGKATVSTTTGLTFNGTNGSGGFGFAGTLANINAALNGLVFRANNNYSGAASLQIQADDQGNTGTGGAKTDSKTVAITVAPNQAPVLVAGSGSAAWLQGGGAVAVAPALTASDADSPNLAGATVSITGGFASGQDVLAFASANGISATYAASTGVLTLTGASSVANYHAALRSITYNNTAGTPTAGTRTISFVANDGSLNSAAVTRTVTVAVRPSTTIVSGPPTLGNSRTVNFVFSSDQSPVEYATTGNPAFAYTNNGPNSNFGPLADGTYTLSVAARNTSTGLTDPSPVTYTFTVDTQRPTPTISSAVANGGTTTTSPIPFTITFSESVTSFALADITVSGGTKGNFVAVSPTQYTFELTPGAAGTYTVNVAADVATDAATNKNLAAAQYGVIYALPATAAPTVSFPTNGSTIASTTPTYTGTAVAGSLVTVYVDNVSIGMVTAAGGGWSLLQPSALTQATHTVKATAQSSGAAVSSFSSIVNFTVDVTAPNVPTVTYPAAGSFVATARPAYSGTGAAGSIITVYVDNTSIGTTTIAAGGSTWSLAQPTDLAQGAHTVKVTATDGVGNVSAFSAANTFTVDRQGLTVAVSSPVGASGSTTATTPVPFTVTFSKPVTGFTLNDIALSSGTPGSFATVSASQYTFSVTPTGAGTMTVSVPVGVAQDQAGNTNQPSFGPAFYLNYQPRPTITSLSAAAELPGMPVVVTGTGFTSASTATVGNVDASVTFTSATSLTVLVPVTAAVGSSTIIVTTNGVPSTSAPAFSVLKVYDAAANCLSTASYLTTGDGAWHYLLASGQVVAALHDTDADLGTVSLDFLVTGGAGAVRQDARGHYYFDRNFHLTASGGPFVGSSIEVRFYGLTSELARLTAADPAATFAALTATQYSGPDEDCDLANNGAGESRALQLVASTPGNGVAWFVAQATVADHFSEFYLTSSATPLPVQLVAFTAEQRGSTVALAWRTVSELNSARFEVERSADGVVFVKINQLPAAGTSPTAHAYSAVDAAPGTGQVYYRLRQVDLDGKAMYSPVRTVAVVVTRPALFPNPAYASSMLTGAAAGASVDVYDALGRVLLRTTADAAGTATLRLPPGGYVVRTGAQTLRLLMQ